MVLEVSPGKVMVRLLVAKGGLEVKEKVEEHVLVRQSALKLQQELQSASVHQGLRRGSERFPKVCSWYAPEPIPLACGPRTRPRMLGWAASTAS